MAFEVYAFDADGADHFFRYSADALACDLSEFYGLPTCGMLALSSQFSQMQAGTSQRLTGSKGQIITVKVVESHIVAL